MSYNPPVESQDVRIRFDAALDAWVLEQETVRFSNGATDVHDLGAMVNLGDEQWELRYRSSQLFSVVLQALAFADNEDVRVRSIALDPLSSQSPTVTAVKDYLELFRV